MVKEKKPRSRIPKGTKRGRKMSEKSRQDLARAQAQWDLVPDLTLIRMSYLTGIGLSLIEEWSRKGYLVRPEPKVVVPPPPPPVVSEEEVKKVIRESRSQDDDWDVGPVPTIESIRREIKRNIKDRMGDSLMVSQYATALGKLDGIKDREEADAKEQEESVMIYLPNEDKQAPPP
jgi:hypothetical protein